MTWKSQFRVMSVIRQAGKAGGGKLRRCHIGPLSALLVLASGLSMGVTCGVPGDRAEYGCPPDEVCSPETPNGLHFQGRRFGDEAPFDGQDHLPATAVGGVQTFTVDPAGLFADLGQFTADCPGGDFTAIRAEPSEMTVSALAEQPGSSKLRILEERTGALFDRITIRSVEMTALEIAPITVDEQTPPDQWPLLYAGAPTKWIARLRNEAERLVDERTAIVSGDESSVECVTPVSWDVAEVMPSADATMVTVKVSVGSARQAWARAEVTHHIDEIRMSQMASIPSTVERRSHASACFQGFWRGRPVSGLDWRVTIDKPDRTTEEMWPSDECASPSGSRCRDLATDQLGVHTVTVQAADMTAEYEYTVLPASARLPSLTPAGAGRAFHREAKPVGGASLGAPGDRARARPAATADRGSGERRGHE